MSILIKRSYVLNWFNDLPLSRQYLLEMEKFIQYGIKQP